MAGNHTLLLFAVFIVSLIGATGNFGFEESKVLFFILSISLIGFLWMGKGVRWTGISKAAGLLLLILLVASLVGIDPKSSLLGREPYFQGWVLYAYLFLFYLMVKTFQIEIKKYALVICISASLVSFLAIKEWIFVFFFDQPIPTYAGRVVSTFGQPNFLAGFLLLSLPFCFFLFKNPDKKLQFLGWGSGLIAMVGILISYSRSAILLALALLLLGLINELRVKFKVGLIVGLVVLGSLSLALVVSSGIVGNEISKPLVTQNPDLTKESVEKRVYIWPQVLKVAWQKPLTGYGLENIGQAVSEYFEENKYYLFEANMSISPVLISLKELNIDRSHNYPLDLLLFSGILGLLGWLGLLGMLFYRLRHNIHDRKQKVLLVALITYLIWVQFQNQSIVQLVYFWLLVGLIDRT